MASALVGIAKPLIGSALGGLFGSRPSRSTQTVESRKKATVSSKEASRGQSLLDSMFKNLMLPVEDPLMAQFRRSLLPLMAEEYTRIQKPIYGEGEIASQLQDIGRQYSGASDLILSKLASVGALGSGRSVQALTDIGLGEAGAKAAFLSGLPMKEELARRSGLGQIFSLMTGLTGRAPIGQVGTGTQKQAREMTTTTEAQRIAEEEAQERQTTSAASGGFWRNFAGNIAKGMGMGEFDPAFESLSNLMFGNEP